jgi:hypothetical protein
VRAGLFVSGAELVPFGTVKRCFGFFPELLDLSAIPADEIGLGLAVVPGCGVTALTLYLAATCFLAPLLILIGLVLSA